MGGGARRGRRLALWLTLAAEETDRQHAEGERAACKGDWLPSRESFDIRDELTRVASAQISAEVLNLFGATISILSQHRLRAFLAKVLARLAKRLGNACHRLDDVLFAHVQPRRDLFRGLFHHRRALLFGASTGRTNALT